MYTYMPLRSRVQHENQRERTFYCIYIVYSRYTQSSSTHHLLHIIIIVIMYHSYARLYNLYCCNMVPFGPAPTHVFLNFCFFCFFLLTIARRFVVVVTSCCMLRTNMVYIYIYIYSPVPTRLSYSGAAPRGLFTFLGPRFDKKNYLSTLLGK